MPLRILKIKTLPPSEVVLTLTLDLFSRYVFKDNKKAALKELGPRFTLKLRSIQKGTFDSKFGEYEWVHKVSDHRDSK